MTTLGQPPMHALSPELREQRLRTVIDELRHHRDGLRKENSRLRDRLERADIKLGQLRNERNRLEARLHLLERELTKAAR